ncbi:MAG: hypothetical protein WA003_04385 [Desulfuromonadaceae bacterium]
MSEKKQVTMEMVAKAVEHCLKEGVKPSRARVMTFMARSENGCCGGDPANVQKKITEYLASKPGGSDLTPLENDEPAPAQHEAIKVVMDHGAAVLSQIWNDLDAGLAKALTAIKSEAGHEFKLLEERVRQDATARIEDAEREESDAVNALQDALENLERANEQLEAMKIAVAGATALAEDRAMRISSLEAAMTALMSEKGSCLDEMQKRLDDARTAAADSAATARERGSEISRLEAALVSAHDEAETAKGLASAAAAIAEERLTTIANMEASLGQARTAEIAAKEQVANLGARLKALEAVPAAKGGQNNGSPKPNIAKGKKKHTKQQGEDLERLQAANDPRQRQVEEMLDDGGQTI